MSLAIVNVHATTSAIYNSDNYTGPLHSIWKDGSVFKLVTIFCLYHQIACSALFILCTSIVVRVFYNGNFEVQ